MSAPAIRLTRIYGFLFAAIFLFYGVLAAAQGDPMELRSTADYTYGQLMNFRLAATNVGQIETVTLFFRINASPDSFSVEVPVESDSQDEFGFALDLTQTRLPPFSSITYWWQLARVDGSPVRIPEQVVSYVDDQFTWRQLITTEEQGGGSVRIHWTGEDDALGEKARDIIFEMLPEIGRLIPIERIVPFDVFIYPSTSDLGAAMRLTGRDFQPGQTYPDLGVVLVTVLNPDTAENELRGELSRGLTDLLLYQALNQFAYNLPPWLNRGLAGAVRGQQDILLQDALRSAIIDGTTIPIDVLCGGAVVDDNVAVAQSESLLAFILTNYGETAVRELVTSFAAGNDCPLALRNSIQLTPQQLEAAWLRANSGNQNTRALAEIAVWLGLVLAGFGLAALLLLRPRH